MGTLSSGVGLISGLNIQQIVEQLIAVEARPRDLLTARIGRIDAQRAAYADISARVTALLGRVSALRSQTAFTATRATSSNESILTVSAAPGAAVSSATFVVRSLAAAHQLVSGGFRNGDATLSAGALTIESAAARADRRTGLAELNGHTGVQRGAFALRDASGEEATIRIGEAQTLADVVDRINQAGVNIRAAVDGNRLTLTETTGGQLQIREVDGGRTAADLGFAAGSTSATGVLTGRDLLFLADSTPLAALNDGNGLRTARGGGDFRIVASDLTNIEVDLSDVIKVDTRIERLNDGQGVTLGRIRISTRDGGRQEVDLTGLTTVGEIKTAIEDAVDGVTVTLTGSRLVVADTRTIPPNEDGTPGTPRALIIEDIDGGTTARQLGIAGRAESGTYTGRDILHVDSLRSVIAAINYASNNTGQVVAAIAADGRSLTLTDNAGGTGRLALQAVDGSSSRALADLGFQFGEYGRDSVVAGARILGGVDTTLLSTLNGGNGLAGGVLRITAGAASFDADLSAAQTLNDVIAGINSAATAAGAGVTAALDGNGTRLLLSTTDGSVLSVADLSGSLGADLGLAGAAPASALRSDNLQRRYLGENTELAALNNGRGVSLGAFRITNSAGRIADINLGIGRVTTLQDVIDEINAADIDVTARLNDTGDGLLLEDSAGGGLGLRVEDVGGTTARDLNIRGEATGGRIDGAFEFRFDVAGGETVDELIGRINERGNLATAAGLNDGSGFNPYRLSIASSASGRIGELLLDGGTTGLNFSTLSRARDAVVVVGEDPESGIVLTSSTNTLENVVGGLTLNLSGVDDEPVTVAVERDRESITTAIEGLVSDFNAIMDRIDDLSSYDPETERAGALLGDGALQIVQNRLFRLVTGALPGAGGDIRRLSDVGVRVGDGARLTFDRERFSEALEGNEDAVVAFFTNPDTGVAARMKTELDRLTQTGGVLKRRSDGLGDQREALTDRIDAINTLLERKRERLTRQFLAMEQALSRLQAQQQALGGFAVPSTGAASAAR